MTKKFASFIAPLLTALIALAISFGTPSNASAGEFVLEGSASYQFLYHNPDHLPQRMANLAAIRNKNANDNVNIVSTWGNKKVIQYHGVMVDIQPEYRFTEWFGLGLNLGLGGMVSENYDSLHPQWVSSTKYDNFVVPNDFKHLSFEALLTFKFIAPLEIVDLWFELGAGIYMLSLEYLTEGGKFEDVGEFFDGIYPDLRGRLGVTFYPNETMGIGIHGGASYLGFGQNDTFSAEGGIHFLGKF